MTAAMPREDVVRLPAVITLEQLGHVLGLSEPAVRQLHRNGELEQLGIRVNRLGAQYRVITSSVLLYLGLIRPADPPAPVLRPVRDGAA